VLETAIEHGLSDAKLESLQRRLDVIEKNNWAKNNKFTKYKAPRLSVPERVKRAKIRVLGEEVEDGSSDQDAHAADH
jgi:hypothetical protein